MDWLTKPDALARLGCSERTLDRHVELRRIEKRTVPVAGRRPQPLFSARDIDAIRAQLGQELHPAVVAPPIPSPLSRNDGVMTGVAETARQAVESAGGNVAELAGAIAQLARSLARPHGPWLTIKAAAQASGLSLSLVRRLVREGVIPAIRDGRALKVARSTIDSWEGSAELLAAARAPRPKLAPPVAELTAGTCSIEGLAQSLPLRTDQEAASPAAQHRAIPPANPGGSGR